MKNISYIINGVLAVAIIVLYILHFNSGGKKVEEGKIIKFNKADTAATLPIAYVNVDTILSNYNLAKDANENLMRKLESSNATMKEKQQRLQTEYAEFQRKVQANAFLSEERAQQEYLRLQNMDKELKTTGSRLDDEFRREQQKLNNQLTDSVRNVIKTYNKTANLQIILSNSGMDNVLYAKEKYDITSEILTLLNKRYSPAKK
ncbi:MAG: OmpH family outer membrane protein [Dysgonamonadaceae bacterium]